MENKINALKVMTIMFHSTWIQNHSGLNVTCFTHFSTVLPLTYLKQVNRSKLTAFGSQFIAEL